MKHPVEHFVREAKRAVPHLPEDEQRKWAEHCAAAHPEVGAPSKTKTDIAISSGHSPRVILRTEECRYHAAPIDRWAWLSRAAILGLLAFCSAKLAHCQDPQNRTDPVNPLMPLLWVTSDPSGSCTGVSIRYVYTDSPPSLWGCNSGTGMWTQIGGGSSSLVIGTTMVSGGISGNVLTEIGGTVVSVPPGFLNAPAMAILSWGPGSIANGGNNSTTMLMPSARVGQPVGAGCPVLPAGFFCFMSCPASGLVTVTVVNLSGSTQDPGTQYWTARVSRQ